jgi:5'-nucleotidase (lipoprotein e(P4) family)
MRVVPWAIAFGLGLAAGAGVVSATQAPPPKKDDPPYRGLDANLYIQTSAEFAASCHQAYALAEARLVENLKAKPAGGKPPAVVLDLDETVIDNGAFQSAMIRSEWAYDQRLFDLWEETGGAQVTLIPGAKAFLDKVKTLGANTVYISNRNDKFRAATAATLDRLGVGVPSGQLLLATDTSNKTARRAKAAEAFDVLLFVGDNLRDFDDRFRFNASKGLAGRKAEVEATKSHFGDDWIILPNPAYGEWTKALGKGKADADLLVPPFGFKP